MNKSTWILCVIFSLSVTLTGSVLAGDTEENLTYQGNKARITVGTFKSKASDCDYGMAAAIGEMLSTALVNTGKFVVLASLFTCTIFSRKSAAACATRARYWFYQRNRVIGAMGIVGKQVLENRCWRTG